MNSIMLISLNDAECRLAIDTVASELGVEPIFVSFGEHLADLVDRVKPFVLIIEFTNDTANWLQRHIANIKDDHSEFPIIGITTTDQESDFTRLERAGCDQIFNKKAFLKKAKSAIEKYLR